MQQLDVRELIKIVEGKSVLLELNVVNVNDIETKVREFLPGIADTAARQWFYTAVRKYLINDELSNNRITSISSNAPDWLRKRHQENVPLYHFSFSTDLVNKLTHVVDWLNSLYQVSKETSEQTTPTGQAKHKLIVLAKKYLSNLNLLDIKSLLVDKQTGQKHHIDDWFELLSNTFEDKEDVSKLKEVISYEDGYRWLELKTSEALEREGKLMQHCVGGYCAAVKSGKTHIYSLRDSNNKPHCTIEIENLKVSQIKGKQNRTPVAKYIPYVKDFLNKFQFPPSSHDHDLKQIGLMWDEKTQKYGTFYENSELIEKMPSGTEIIKEGNSNTYHLWVNDKSYGTIKINPSYDDLQIDILINNISEDEETNESAKKFYYKEAVDFINKNFAEEQKKFSGYNNGNIGQYGYCIVDKKITNLAALEPVAHLTNSDVIYLDRGWLFVDPNDHTKIFTKITKWFSIEWFKSELYDDIYTFLNSISEKPTENDINVYHHNGKEYEFVFSKADDKWETYREAAKILVDLGNVKAFEFASQRRIYIGDDEILRWRDSITNPQMAVKNAKKISQYAQQVADILNRTHLISDGRKRDSVSSILKPLGITFNGSWKAPNKSETTGYDYNIIKVTTSKANITDKDGVKVGELTYESKESISYVIIDNKEVGDFLVKYSQDNPQIEFRYTVNQLKPEGRSSKYSRRKIETNTELWGFGFMEHADKFVRIKDVFPTVKIISGDNGFVWYQKGYILRRLPKGDTFGLLNPEIKKWKLVVYTKDKKVTEIILCRNDDEDSLEFSEENIAPYIDNLNDLIKAQNLEISNTLLVKGSLEFKDGKIAPIQDSSKVKQFAAGKIVYEDGHAWVRRSDEEWILVKDINERWSSILQCKIVNGEIHNITFTNEKYKQNKKLYREYLIDMLDILDEME